MAVFPVQISVIDPIFSAAFSLFTNNFSFLRVSIEKAMAIWIDRGNPSGTATMMIEMAMVKYPIRVEAVVISNKSVEVKTTLTAKKIH